MDVGEARKAIYDLTKFYFQNAAVTYAKQSFRVKPTKPLVTLSFGSIMRPLNPPVKVIDGRPASFYPSTMMVQIDLFTKGKQRSIAEGITPVMENTAANDLMKFADFLGSEYAVQYCSKKDIARTARCFRSLPSVTLHFLLGSRTVQLGRRGKSFASRLTKR